LLPQSYKKIVISQQGDEMTPPYTWQLG